MLGFFQSFISVKGKQVGDDVVKALVEMDPEAATQAELVTMERDLDKAGQVLQKLRADYNREIKEADAAEKTYNELLSAAEVLKTRLENPATSDDQKSQIERSMGALLVRLEEMVPEVEREKQDVVEVRAMLEDAEKVYREKAQGLTTARQKLDRAKRDMQRASLDEERAQEKAARAAEVAGFRQRGSNILTVALNAMEKRADEAKAAAETARTKASILSTSSNQVAGDTLVADALAQVRGQGVPGASLTDRLAALKKR
ncbi:MAG: hypothetical protein K2Q10_10680 [Rhodospirillales bacterium]|nr:hypothetical protein [Rhodospirillales bacterium]